jgi:hypothetical protein
MATSYPRSKTVLVTLAALASLSAAPAEAEQCRAKQINGRWALYFTDALGGENECLIRVRGARRFSGECSNPTLDLPPSPVDGTLRLSRSCVLSGGFSEATRFVGSLQPNGQGGAGLIVQDDSSVAPTFILVRRP